MGLGAHSLRSLGQDNSGDAGMSALLATHLASELFNSITLAE
jgi:hypothetical protein